MYLSEHITVKINPSNFKYFRNKYDIKVGDEIIVSIDELSKGSTTEIKLKCDNCGKITEMKYNSYIKYGHSCGNYLCKTCNSKKNNFEKYGVENVFQIPEVKKRIKETIKEKYGVDYISQLKKRQIKSEIDKKNINDKRISTNNKKYGVDNVSQIDIIKEKKSLLYNSKPDEDKNEIKDKRYKTNLKLYGVKTTFLDKNTADKIKYTNLIKYGVDNPSKCDLIKNKIRLSCHKSLNIKTLERDENIINIDNDNKILTIYCDCCQQEYKINTILYYKRREYNTTLCTICNPIDKHISGKEIQLSNFIKNNYDGEIVENDRTVLSGKELDIYLPELKLAFEFNGIYWHSELYKDKNYHQDKYLNCRNKNIQLIQIWEDDWNYKQNIIKSMILNKLNKSVKIAARKCSIREVNSVFKFLKENHIQGYVSSTIKLGLYYNDELISVMTFKKNKNEYDLNRYCTKLGITVIGGASKLLNYFMKNYEYEQLTTFSNNSYSNGDLYNKIGFKILNKLRPDYSYIVDGIRFHKFNFRKNNEDLIKIYDAGKIKWII
jgi:uncharacterized protein CbrC (UPF0167 family)